MTIDEIITARILLSYQLLFKLSNFIFKASSLSSSMYS
jgi:hypothetical protein